MVQWIGRCGEKALARVGIARQVTGGILELGHVAVRIVAGRGNVAAGIGRLRHFTEAVVSVLRRRVVGLNVRGDVAVAVEEIAAAVGEWIGGHPAQAIRVAVDEGGAVQGIDRLG